MTPTPLRSGKVRDLYDAEQALIIVASDRISAFDCVLGTPIPNKGKILNRLALFWFERTGHIVPNHILASQLNEFPEPWRAFGVQHDWQARAVLVRRARVIPVECVVRGYLAGSGWASYQSSGKVCGVRLPPGLSESEQLPEPIFTPTTKPETGHDEPISFDATVDLVGPELAEQLRSTSLQLYKFASDLAQSRGIILADTKFEFGIWENQLLLVDEMGTPDSSRFWDQKQYQPGGGQASFDKQFVRDYLESSGWDKRPPAPALPQPVVDGTLARYRQAYELITGTQWDSLAS